MINKMTQKPDYTFSILLLGNTTVGKTSLIHRFIHQTPIERTQVTVGGLHISSRTVQIAGKKIKLLMNDTAGQERFRSIARSYYKNADAIVLVYDISDGQSFEELSQWIEDIDTHTKNDIPKMLLANKCDLQAVRTISYIDGANHAQFLKIPFFQTSAINGRNVQQAFLKIGTQLKELKELQELQDNLIKLQLKKKPEVIKIVIQQRPRKRDSCRNC